MTGVRVGWSRDHGSLEVDAELGANFDAQAAVFESLGCRVESRDIPLDDVDRMFDIICYERVLADTHPIFEHNIDGLDPGLARHYERVRDLTGGDFLAAHDARRVLWREVADAFEVFDVLVWPNEVCDACGYDDEEAAASNDWSLLYVAALLGMPAITVPCGFSAAGAPRGVQILGAPGADLLIAQVAYAYEQATGFGKRRPSL